jgi:hypothetical protein
MLNFNNFCREPQSGSARKAALISLDILRKKAIEESQSSEPKITYLRARHLLPFFYRCLSDKDKDVRTCALVSIQNFGPQGELLFIEGVTKEQNATIRAECATGLGRIGVSAFRTLLLTLSDGE